MRGLFLGLTTLDIIYLAANYPGSNEKMVALDGSIVAGGPATNAAVAFTALNDHATLASVIGNHPLGNLIETDLRGQGVNLIDLSPDWAEPPPLSSIIVTERQGDRSVISLNATRCRASGETASLLTLDDTNIILVDGHQILVSEVILQEAADIPVVLDGGSWKPGLEKILPYINYAICSENFQPPGCQNQEDIFHYFKTAGICQIAITRGENSIEYVDDKNRGSLSIVPVEVLDTLGAGDIFHGAFCHYILKASFIEALEKAAKIASFSCKFFGTRQWIKELNNHES